MKKLLLGFAAIAISAGAYAQTDSTSVKLTTQNMNKSQSQTGQSDQLEKSLPDGVRMQNGQVMKVKNGQSTVLDQDVTLSNGTKVSRDGTCIKKDGTKTKLKEGQHYDMSGNLVTTETNMDRNMYIVPDSTDKKDY